MSFFDKMFNNSKQKSTDSDVISVVGGAIDKLVNNRSNVDYYDVSPYLNKAIQKRAEKIAETEWYLESKSGDEIWSDNEWLDLLNNPNDDYSGSEFWRLYQTHKDLTGEVFIWTAKDKGKIKEMYLLPPNSVTTITDDNRKYGKVVGYKYKGNNFDTDEILHDISPSPDNPLEPEALINEGARDVLQTEEYINKYHSHVIENGGTANKIIQLKGEKTKERQKERKDKLEDKLAESSQTGKPTFFSGEVEIDDFGMNPEELNYLETKRAILEDIAIITGVPASMLSSYADTKYSNAEVGRKNFLREYIKPEVDAITTFLNQELIPDKFELKFVDPVPEEIDKKLKLVEIASKVKALTTNEKREMISKLSEELDLDSIDDGDEIDKETNNIVINSESD